MKKLIFVILLLLGFTAIRNKWLENIRIYTPASAKFFVGENGAFVEHTETTDKQDYFLALATLAKMLFYPLPRKLAWNFQPAIADTFIFSIGFSGVVNSLIPRILINNTWKSKLIKCRI